MAVDVNTLKSWVDIVGTAVTTLAVLVGASWAYFKFVKGRTFRPRLEVQVSARWLVVDASDRIHVQIVLKNIGASKVTLRQQGTGLSVSGLAEAQPVAPTTASWVCFRIFEIFLDHAWIEPGETIADDLLLSLEVPRPATVMLHARLVLSRSILRNIEVNARAVIPVAVDGTPTQNSNQR